MADKDLTEKTLEAFNDVFSDIVNGLLFKGKQVVQENTLTDAQPFSMFKADGDLHEQDRDVAKYWNTISATCINVRTAFLGIENQTRYEKDMPLRTISYDGAAYRSQLSQAERYPVITLILYFGNTPWEKSRSLYEVIAIPEELRPYVNDYKINVFEIAYLPEEAIDYFHSDFRIVVDFFVHKRLNPGYRPVNPAAFQHVDEILKMMKAITQDDRFTESLNAKGEKPKNMCEVLDFFEEKGRQEGIEEGRKEGIEEGRKEGIEEGRKEGIEEGRKEGIEEGIRKALSGLVKDGILTTADAARRADLSIAEFQAEISGRM